MDIFTASILICFALFAVAALFCFRRAAAGGFACPCMSWGPARNEPLDILEKRFARGEINQTEYEERIRVLIDGPPKNTGAAPARTTEKEETT